MQSAALANFVRATRVMKDYDLGALVATTRPNFLYATGSGRTLPFVVQAKVGAVLSGVPARLAGLVVPRIEAPNFADLMRSGVTVVTYGGFFFAPPSGGEQRDSVGLSGLLEALDAMPRAASFGDGLALVLGRVVPADGLVGWDDPADPIDLDGYAFLERSMDAREVWRSIRRVKTGAEIERLADAARINEAIEADLIDHCRVGVDLGWLRRRYEGEAIRRNASPGFWSSGAAGNAGVIMDDPGPRFRAGDLVRFDFGVEHGHYWSDTGRTVSIGEPSSLAARRIGALLSGIEAGWKAVRPGAVPSDIFELVVGTIRDAGFGAYRRHHVGHSIGAEMYDGTMIAPDDDTPLEEDMVINLEVPYYEPGWGGLQIEDTAVIRRSGVELLTHRNRGLTVNW